MTADQALTADDAAARLGVKRETLYAYVSRGLVSRTTGPDGRSSRFDPVEIEQLRQGRRPEHDGQLSTLITSRLTRVDDDGLLVRGHDLVALVASGTTFTQVVDLLWVSPDGERWPLAGSTDAATTSVVEVAAKGSLLDALRVITALRSSADPLRHDLSPPSVRSAGRGLIMALAFGLPPKTSGVAASGDENDDVTIAGALWRRLSPQQPDPARLQALDAALALAVDHGLAGSSLAARIAGSVRADPYSVVAAGLGVLGGTLHGAASAAVYEMLAGAGTSGDPASAVGAARRRLGVMPGFGHSVYTERDPRAAPLMDLVASAWAGDPRLGTVRQVSDLVTERANTFPNVDLSLGALTWLADMPVDAGEVIFAVARTAGWLAHAMEEYDEKPLRFRARARYEGPRP